MPRRSAKRTGWVSAQDQARKSVVRQMRDELFLSTSALTQPARTVFAQTGASMPVKVVTYFEVLVDLSVSPVGRVVTATAALMLAWWII